MSPNHSSAARANARFARIVNWAHLAHEAGYSVGALAEKCGVCVRTLEKHFIAIFGTCPRQRLKLLRMENASELLRDGSNVNETADLLGYRDRSHFSREFKKFHGLTPRRFARLRCRPGREHQQETNSHLAT